MMHPSINGLTGWMNALLAWRPFLDPLNVHDSWWYFLVPLAFLISLTYRAARLRTLEKYWFSVFSMTIQIVFAMIGLVIASYLFVAVYVRFIAERAG
ncbi:MAG: hypothetical protein H7210_04115 [Pyrinomonadaceae bacterium]|nr:hypothetical protein [Phycisphaerales bacterium]